MALFDTVTEFKDYVPFNVANEMQSLNIWINRAVPKVLFPYMDKAFYDSVVALKGGSPSALELQLIQAVQMPVANMAAFLAIPNLNIQVSASGVHMTMNEHKKPAFEWQMEKVRTGLLDAVSEGQEALVSFLEANASSFTAWRDSDTNKERRKMFVNTPQTLNDYVYTDGKATVFWKVMPYFKRSEGDIKGELGQDLFDQLKTQLENAALSTENEKLMPFIKAYCSYKGVAEAVSDLAVMVTRNGIKEESASQGFDNETAAGTDAVRFFKDQKEEAANRQMNRLRAFLSQNAADYPLWEQRQPSKPENSKENKIFNL